MTMFLKLRNPCVDIDIDVKSNPIRRLRRITAFGAGTGSGKGVEGSLRNGLIHIEL